MSTPTPEMRLRALEREDLHSYRRDGAAAGRLAGLVWTTGAVL